MSRVSVLIGVAVLVGASAFYATAVQNRGPVGTFELDSAQMGRDMKAAVEQVAGKLPGAFDTLLQQANKSSATLKLAADGTFDLQRTEITGKKSHLTGKWTLDGDQITITETRSNGKTGEQFKGTVKGDTIEIPVKILKVEFPMTFRKQPK